MKLFRILILTFFAYALISCGGAEERKAVYLEKAKASMEAGDLDKARIELKNVLQIDPKYGEGYYQLGKVYEQQKDYRKAFTNYLKTERLNPEHLANQARLGRIYLLLANEPDKAKEKVDFILSKDPVNAEGLLLKALTLIKNDDKEEAVVIIVGVINREPGHVEAVSLLTGLYVTDNKISDALTILDNALKSNQDNEQLNKLLALVLVKNKDYDRAEELYKKFLERNPNNASSYNNLAAFYNQVGDKEKAEKTLRASVENDSSDVDRQIALVRYIKSVRGSDVAVSELKELVSKNSGLGKLRIALAELLSLNKDKQAAIEVYKQAVKDFPDEVTGVDARLSLATLYINDKAFEKAKNIVEDAVKVSPNDPKVNFLKAKLALHDKDTEQAIISLRIVTKETPENIEAFVLLANAYKLENSDEQYNSTLNSAYQNNKTNPDGLLKLARYQLSRDPMQAEKIIDDYNNAKESDYDGLSIKAAILNQSKKQAEAYKISKTLMELFVDKPNGYLQSIPYLAVSGDRDAAISVLEKGYLSTKDNRKILLLLTALQSEEKQYDVVEKRLNAELSANSDDTELKVLLSKVYILQKKFESAEKELKDVISINSKIEEPYLLLSQIYQSTDPGSVKSILISGRDNAPSSIKIPLRLAAAYEADKSYKKAIDVYRGLNESYPDNLIIMNNLASMLSDYSDTQEDLTLAKSLADKLKETGQPTFLDTVGWVYYKLGKYDESVQFLKQVIEKAPEVNVFNYHLGMAYKMSGDKARAKIYLEKSLAGDKEFKQKELAKDALRGL